MYQQELFKEAVRNSHEYLGSGINGTVFDCGRTVLKVSRNSDRTRNWLEFCLMCYETGWTAPLVPEVYSLVDAYTEGSDTRFNELTNKWESIPKVLKGYVVCMKKYTPQAEDINGRLMYCRYSGSRGRITDHHAFDEVAEAYQKYLTARLTFRPNLIDDLFDDCHGGNIMMDGKRPIITDPSNQPYYEPFVPALLELRMQ